MQSPRLLLAALWILVALLGRSALAADVAPAPVFPSGPHAVGSTNMAVTLPAAGERPMMDYLNGKVEGQRSGYIDEIITQRDAAPLLKVTVPPTEPGAGVLAGRQLPVLLYILYPTTVDNPRPDYRFPYKDTGDNVFPHMQRPGERPLFAAAGAKYPVVVYSGGYNTHGLWHLAHLKHLASHGYIVVDIFHGDARAMGYFESVALRRVAFRAALDYVLSQPDFAAAADA